MIALAFSLVGAIILSTYGSPPSQSHPWIFWFAAFWTIAQALLVSISISSFRSALRERQGERQLQRVARLHRSILDSAGPMMIACDLSGRINLFNPAAERMLGYRTSDAVGKLTAAELFPESEMARVGEQLAASMPAFRTHPEVPPNTAATLHPYVRYVATFPASRVRGFEMRYRRRDGSTFPAMVYLSAVRSSAGTVEGLVSIAVDLSATRRAEHALRESEERYRDLFDNSAEMIATLSPRGRYLYVNPSWQALFGMDSSQFESLISFEAAFPPEMQNDAAALFDRALRGERIDRANLRVQDANGMYRELEASLSCRQDRGEPVSVRCIFRDVTAQYQRERRLAMQLAVSQVVGESTTSDEALPAMLESLGTNLGFDMAGLWFVSSDHHTRYLAGWYAPDRACVEFHRDSIGRVLQKGKDLPGQIWAAESPVWIEDLQEDTNFLRAK